MDIWTWIAAVSLLASFLADFWFNRVVLESKIDAAEGAENPQGVDIVAVYRDNRPDLLRRIGPLDILVERGGSIFYYLFAIAVIARVFMATRSFLWILAVIPILVVVFFATNLAAVWLAGRAARRKKIRP
ncbi:MAG: hypothetical protein ACOWWM_19705 [Desulfobacterales bacterium]